MQAQPEGLGGKAIPVVIQARRGKIAEAKRNLKALQDDPRNPMPADVKWVIAQLVEDVASMEDAVVPLYEAAMQKDQSESRRYYYDDGFAESPGRRLVLLYKRAGRIEEAHALLTKAAQDPDSGLDIDADWAARMRSQRALTIGQQFLELGYPADAVRLWNAAGVENAAVEFAGRFVGENFAGGFQDGIRRGLEGLNRENLRRTLDSLLKPPADWKKAKGLDLVLMVQPRELSQASVVSLVAVALKSAAGMPELLAAARIDLKKRLENEPREMARGRWPRSSQRRLAHLPRASRRRSTLPCLRW
jgi:hypothetical protein